MKPSMRWKLASIGISTTANPLRARPPQNSTLSTIFTPLAVPADSTHHPLTNDQSQFLPEEAEHLSDAISLAPTKKIRDWRVSRRTSVRSFGSLGSLQKIRGSFADFLQQGCQQTKRYVFIFRDAAPQLHVTTTTTLGKQHHGAHWSPRYAAT